MVSGSGAHALCSGEVERLPDSGLRRSKEILDFTTADPRFDSIVVTPASPSTATRSRSVPDAGSRSSANQCSRAPARASAHKVVGITAQRQVDHHLAGPPILREAGVPTLMGGNSASPSRQDRSPRRRLSSNCRHQLDLTKTSPATRGPTQHHPGPLDRYYGSGLCASKRAFSYQSPHRIAIVDYVAGLTRTSLMTPRTVIQFIQMSNSAIKRGATLQDP